MNFKRAKWLVGGSGLVLALLISPRLPAQTTTGAISGTVTSPSGAIVANAKIIAIQMATGQATETQSDSAGHYSFAGLVPGDYEVSASVEGLGAKSAKVSVEAGGAQTLDLALAAAGPGGGPSLEELGFPTALTQANAQEQARLDKRSRMLKTHQKLGLVTAGLMAATVATSFGAKGHHGVPGSSTGRNLHMGLGIATTDLYFTSAYFAIRAPKIHGAEVRGPIRVHKTLAWIHGTGMILTPILGSIAYAQQSRGERVHGIAKQHGLVATVTYSAFAAAIVSVSFKF